MRKPRPGKFVAQTRGALSIDNSARKGVPFDFSADDDEIAAAAADDRREADAIDRITEDAIGQLGGLGDDVMASFEDLIAGASSLEEVKELLAIHAGEMVAAMDFSAVAQLGERMGFGAKIAGLVREPGK